MRTVLLCRNPVIAQQLKLIIRGITYDQIRSELSGLTTANRMRPADRITQPYTLYGYSYGLSILYATGTVPFMRGLHD